MQERSNEPLMDDLVSDPRGVTLGLPKVSSVSDDGFKRLLQQERADSFDLFLELQAFAWSTVEFRGDPVEVLGRVD